MENTQQKEVKRCPRCSAEVLMVQYGRFYDPETNPWHYDGVSEIRCANDCGWRIGRWCGLELRPEEVERPYCEGQSHPYDIPDYQGRGSSRQALDGR